MDCHELQKLVHGYVDGELDLMKNLEIDAHLHECAACAQTCAELQAVRTAIKESAPYYQAPSGLQNRIRGAVRRASRAEPVTRARVWPLLGVAASVMIALLAGWGLLRILSPRSEDSFLTQELLASHVRSQMLPGHRVDVASSNQHVVKPWFEGKLDFSPTVRDFAEQGFPLLGGRLDYLDNRPVAALVYHRREHVINLFIWPSTPGSEAAPRTRTRQGYHLVHWTQAGMNYWAISNLNERELEDFVQLVREKAR